MESQKIETAWKVTAEDVKFLSVTGSGIKDAGKDFNSNINRLEKFLRKLEKKFGEIIWYIGSDIFGNNIYERFMFKKSGFMEIIIGKNTAIEAYFPSKEKAEKFSSALNATFSSLGVRGGRTKVFKVE